MFSFACVCICTFFGVHPCADLCKARANKSRLSPHSVSSPGCFVKPFTAGIADLSTNAANSSEIFSRRVFLFVLVFCELWRLRRFARFFCGVCTLIRLFFFCIEEDLLTGRSRSSSCPPAHHGRKQTEDTLWFEANKDLCQRMSIAQPKMHQQPKQDPMEAQSLTSIVKGNAIMKSGRVHVPASAPSHLVPKLADPSGQAFAAAPPGISIVHMSMSDFDNAPTASEGPDQDEFEPCPQAPTAPPLQKELNDTTGRVDSTKTTKHSVPVRQTPAAAPSWVSIVKSSVNMNSGVGKAAVATQRSTKAAVAVESNIQRPCGPSATIVGSAASAKKMSGELKGKGFGKGLAHFQRIKVGIEDDNDFRVVRRLLGPAGKNVKDILSSCTGAKMWICGRGSRSWEDSQGPLTICVGSSNAASYQKAARLVNDLLRATREAYAKFNARRA